MGAGRRKMPVIYCYNFNLSYRLVFVRQISLAGPVEPDVHLAEFRFTFMPGGMSVVF
jgi:hypothetical protein